MVAVSIGMGFFYGSQGSWLRESGVLNNVVGQFVFGSLAAWQALILTALLQRMSVEDGVLKNHFGKEWDEWVRNVPNSVIPWIY